MNWNQLCETSETARVPKKWYCVSKFLEFLKFQITRIQINSIVEKISSLFWIWKKSENVKMKLFRHFKTLCVFRFLWKLWVYTRMLGSIWATQLGLTNWACPIEPTQLVFGSTKLVFRVYPTHSGSIFFQTMK